jgi:hypothetical protein
MFTLTVVHPLDVITDQINRYGTLCLLLCSLIGNVFSCIVFSRRDLRSKPCCVCFLAAALVNLIVCVTAFTPRILNGWNNAADLSERISALCRLLMFMLFTARCMVAWIIALASVDRYLISSRSTRRRQMSNLKNAYRSLVLICVMSLLVWSEVFFCFDANLVGTPIKCYTTSDACQIYNNLAHALLTILVPATVMLVFGFATIENIRRSRLVAPVSMPEQTVSRNRRTESSLTKMLVMQVLVLTLCSLPLAVMTLYLSATFYRQKSLERHRVEGFVFNIVLLMQFKNSQ